MKKQNKSQSKGKKFEDKCQKTINSGALWFQKGDLDYQGFCIDSKFTEKKGFRLTLTILEKLWNESLDVGKEPLIEIGIRRDKNTIFKVSGLVTVEKLKE